MDARRIARAGGVVAVAAGLLGAAAAVFLLTVPPGAPVEHFNYPLAPTAFVAVQIAFCFHHLLMAFAMWAFGRAGLAGHSRLAGVSGWFAVAGLTLLGLWELVAIAGIGLPWPSDETAWLDTGYGLASIAVGIALTLLGVAAVRATVLSGPGRWIVLVTGVYVFVPMTPALFAGFVTGRIVLGVWLLLFAGIGLAMLDWARRADADAAPVPVAERSAA